MRIKTINWLCMFLLVLILSALNSFASPHSVEGKVLHSDGTTGVDDGTPVRINDTDSGDSVLTYVSSGLYSTTIDGSDGDNILVTSWNSSHYRENTSTLEPATTTINVVVNTSRPSETNVTITDPVNNSVKNISLIFNVTAEIAIIGGISGTNCFAKINLSNENTLSLYKDDDYEHSLGDISLGAYETTTWNVTGIKEDSSNISVTAYCDSDDINLEEINYYTIYNLSINDTNPPKITLISPSDNNWTNNENLTLSFNVTDPSNIKNCSLYFNNTLNLTEVNIKSGSLSRFLLNNTLEGNHTWFVSCYDNSTNFNQKNSSTWLVRVDLTAPTVNLMAPENNSVVSNNTVIFKYNTSDDYGEVHNCSLIVDNSNYQTKNDIIENKTQNFTQVLLGSYYYYNWTIKCTDRANNSAYSEIWFINVTDPDLSIVSSDIKFSIEYPVGNQYVVINATVYNLGSENATNVTIQFFENEPYSDQIGSSIHINLSRGQNRTVNTTWNSKMGSYNIHVVVDPPYETNGSISELNESNNVANRSVFIPVYNVYYGKVRADVVLDSLSNNPVFSWFNQTDINGNIYVIDTDSSISWSSLNALGINLTYESSIDDFDEIDVALNLTDFNDSISDIYIEDCKIKDNSSFMVYSNNITDVPITNSTNTSNFITGIFWDSSTEDIDEYNGSQYVVFVTKVNQDMHGSYGSYDYEIKVPVNLQSYIKPNNEDSLTFYVELM